MLKDVRHGARMLVHARGWTAVVVLSLAVGIGASTALFSAINGMLIDPLPVAHPEQLVRLRYAGPNDMVTRSSDYGFSAKGASGLDLRTTFSYPMYQQFVADNRTMTDLFAFAPFGSVNILVDGAADIGRAFLSSGTPPSRRLTQFLCDDGDSDPARTFLHPAGPRHRAESRADQPDGAPMVALHEE